DRVAAQRGPDALLVARRDGRWERARAQHQLEALGLAELLLDTARAHADARLAAADLLADLRGALDATVEDDREALLHVLLGELLEDAATAAVEGHAHVPLAHAGVALVGLGDGVADHVTGELGL